MKGDKKVFLSLLHPSHRKTGRAIEVAYVRIYKAILKKNRNTGKVFLMS
jgi:hypothetical protein